MHNASFGTQLEFVSSAGDDGNYPACLFPFPPFGSFISLQLQEFMTVIDSFKHETFSASLISAFSPSRPTKEIEEVGPSLWFYLLSSSSRSFTPFMPLIFALCRSKHNYGFIRRTRHAYRYTKASLIPHINSLVVFLLYIGWCLVLFICSC